MKRAMSVTFKENVIVFQEKQAEHDIELLRLLFWSIFLRTGLL